MYLFLVGSLFISATFNSCYIIICKYSLAYIGIPYLLWGSIARKLLLIISVKVHAVMNNGVIVMHLNEKMYEYTHTLYIHTWGPFIKYKHICDLSGYSFSQNCNPVQTLAIKVAV